MKVDAFLDDMQLHTKIIQHIESGTYRLTKHAAEEQAKDGIDLHDTLHILKTGFHEAILRPLRLCEFVLQSFFA